MGLGLGVANPNPNSNPNPSPSPSPSPSPNPNPNPNINLVHGDGLGGAAHRGGCGGARVGERGVCAQVDGEGAPSAGHLGEPHLGEIQRDVREISGRHRVNSVSHTWFGVGLEG